jgi:hypothetical protein
MYHREQITSFLIYASNRKLKLLYGYFLKYFTVPYIYTFSWLVNPLMQGYIMQKCISIYRYREHEHWKLGKYVLDISFYWKWILWLFGGVDSPLIIIVYDGAALCTYILKSLSEFFLIFYVLFFWKGGVFRIMKHF